MKADCVSCGAAVISVRPDWWVHQGTKRNSCANSRGVATPAMTDTQEDILYFIKRFVAEKKYPPTVREIGDEVGLTSTSSVHYQLHALVEKGYLEIDDGRRALRVVESA